MTISGHTSKTDWERVKREYDSDAPIPYDPEDGPYDPNDEAATEAYWKEATIWAGWPNPVMIQKDGVPVTPEEAAAELPPPHAKASKITIVPLRISRGNEVYEAQPNSAPLQTVAGPPSSPAGRS